MSEKNGNQDVPSFEGTILGRTVSVPQAPRSIPIDQVGDSRAGNKPYNGDASSARMVARYKAPPPPVS